MKIIKNAPSTAIILENRTPRKDGKFPVKLRVTYQREQKYYSLRNSSGERIALTKPDFLKVRGSKPRGEHKELAIFLNELEKIAWNVIKELSVFSFELFEQRFYSTHGDKQDVFTALKNSAVQLRNEGRISTASSYECALNSLKNHTKKNILTFDKIDVHFLNEYEKWMHESGNNNTTVGIYLRNVRTVFNDALRNEITPHLQYPFGKGKYQIPTGRNIKKALAQNEISLIANYPAMGGTSEQRYLDYWLFCFLCNGLNVKDMAFLKYKNIDGDTIKFIRAKTHREHKEKPRVITVVISQMMGRIIDRWGNKPGLPDEYIFPILKNGLSPQQEFRKIQLAIAMINKYIQKIATAVGITNHVTTYTARHSFATVLKRSGASTEYISESLGHANLQTTENYLADFEISEKRKWAEKVEQATKLLP